VVEMGGKGGGGRPDMAQGGAKDIGGADAAMTAARKVLEG
jgi:alanyl-tRNA synthetase